MIKLSDIGEKAFLRGLLPSLTLDSRFVNGFGHDASVIDLGLEHNIAFKIDRAPFPVAVRRGIGTYRTWGRLAAVANVSDLIAVGARPAAVMISLVLPPSFNAADALAIIQGCEEACVEHGVAFVGGDTKEGDSPQVVGAALGTVEKGKHFGRATARPGDVLFVAGKLGGFAAATELIKVQGLKEDRLNDCFTVLNHPVAHMREAEFLRAIGSVASACDLSDGLADALDIFCSNEVGIAIHENRLPFHHLVSAAAVGSGLEAWRFAFGVGDWSLAFVVSAGQVERFRFALTAGLDVHEIGVFDGEAKRLIVDLSGNSLPMPHVINEHFRQRAEDDGEYSRRLLGRT